MVRNFPIQVRKNADCGSINQTKRGQRTWLRYVVGHHSTSQQNKTGPLLIQDGCRRLQTSSNVPIFP